MKEPVFKKENNVTICEVTDNLGRIFRGEARCHPDDKDFESPITGGVIAEMRARIEVARTYRNDLRVKLAALNQLLYSMNKSSHFSKDSYEAKMLYRQIRLVKDDLEIAKHQLAVLKVDLFEYINEKERVHKYLRKHSEDKDRPKMN